MSTYDNWKTYNASNEAADITEAHPERFNELYQEQLAEIPEDYCAGGHNQQSLAFAEAERLLIKELEGERWT